MHVSIRRPAVAGRFYPRDPEVLREDVRSYLSPLQATIPAIGCVVPHAGYVYSGQVAGAVFSRIEVPQHCIVLCPNHTGLGMPLSIMSEGAWETPLGMARIDSEMAARLKQQFPFLQEDAEAHRAEHAIEVELPFLQVREAGLEFVPIAVGTSQWEILEQLGEALAEAIKAQGGRVLMIASSDMNHYENDRVTRVKDRQAIDPILALDARGLFDVVMQQKISMCGFGPVVAMLTAAKRLRAADAELIKYATSGDASGDHAMVVGYAGIAVW